MEEPDAQERHYQILVFGNERKGLAAPKDAIRTRNFTLKFENFGTSQRYNEFDGVILFQGIFERFEWKSSYIQSYLEHSCDEAQLDKRKKEANLLLRKGGFLCFLLCDRFIDHEDHRDFKGSDLAKYHLNYPSFYRENFAKRVTHLDIKVDDFRRFLEIYGAANSHFRHFNDSLDARIIAEANGRMVGMVLRKLEYFIPALVPDNRPEIVAEYFTLLSDALVSSHVKLYQLLPQWIEAFKFEEESTLEMRRDELTAQVASIDSRLDQLKGYKGVLALSGSELVASVVRLFADGFQIVVDATDDFREDFKLIDENKKPFLLCEVKGTNSGIKREHVNQADSHRERSGHEHTFPTLLIVNTHIKNARSLDEKDKQVSTEQVVHAKRMGVLIVRTLDLLSLFHQFLCKRVTRKEVITLLTTNSGWLCVNSDNVSILSGDEKTSGP